MGRSSRRSFLGLAGVGVPCGVRAARADSPAHLGKPPAGVYDVARFGAVGDGKTLTTAALQKAIDACGSAGGGTVLIPPGRYLSGALFLRSHVHLYLSSGATLVASLRPADFPAIKARDEGIERRVHASLLTGIDLEDVAVTGQGVLDGQGQPWWTSFERTMEMRVAAKLSREAENPPGAPLEWPRPRIINLVRCQGVLVEGLTIKDSPFYAAHLVYCQDVVINRVITSQRIAAHNTGINIDSSKHVQITNCTLSYGGDGIGIKAGYNEDGRRVGIPAEDILISGCQMYHTGDSGVAIGSETAAGIRNVVISNCVIEDCANGVYIRSPRGRGGTVEHIRVSNIVLNRIEETALKVSHFFDSVRMNQFKGGSARRDLEISRSRKAPVDEGTPTFRNFAFDGITMGRVREAVLVEGLPERYVRGLSFRDITVAQASGGVSLSLTAEVSISGLIVEVLESAAVDAREVEQLEVHRLRWARPANGTPAVWLENVAGAFIHACHVGEAAPGYEWLRQQHAREITLAANMVPTRPG
jgi:polygalacturonase